MVRQPTSRESIAMIAFYCRAMSFYPFSDSVPGPRAILDGTPTGPSFSARCVVRARSSRASIAFHCRRPPGPSDPGRPGTGGLGGVPVNPGQALHLIAQRTPGPDRAGGPGGWGGPGMLGRPSQATRVWGGGPGGEGGVGRLGTRGGAAPTRSTAAGVGFGGTLPSRVRMRCRLGRESAPHPSHASSTPVLRHPSRVRRGPPNPPGGPAPEGRRTVCQGQRGPGGLGGPGPARPGPTRPPAGPGPTRTPGPGGLRGVDLPTRKRLLFPGRDPAP